MKASTVVVVAFAPICHVIAAADNPRPRGVSPDFAKHYKSTDSFRCINDPEIRVDLARVNDDYCDCPDGSDEPGTSACSHLNASQLAIPGFYCKNKGHQPAYLPLSYVNDGACDYDICCDGSDEWQGVGQKCADRCEEIGKDWKKQDEKRQKSLTAATRRRKELVVEASRLRKQVEDQIQDLKAQLGGAEIKVSDMEKEVAELERQERNRVVKAPKEGGRLGVLVETGKRRTEELRQSLQTVIDERDDAKARLKELEALLATFKEERNPNFNDEGVKRAVTAWENYAAREKRPETEAAVERDIQEIVKSDEENGLSWAEFQNEESTSDVDVLYKIEEYLPVGVRDWVDQKLRDLRALLVENGILADSSPSVVGESKVVTEAKGRLTAAQTDLDGLKLSITNHEEDLKKDYGPEEVFRSLKDQCISVESGEYEYELCWMSSTTQKPKKGGSNTSLGSFTRFDVTTVDEDVPADGRGLGSGERLTMEFENGQHCWNGPARSTKVVMACAEKDEIWKVVEAEKCVYRYEMGTAAVCGLNLSGQKNEEKPKEKDEL